MTGFGSAEGEVAGGRLVIEIRTVNHRYFNPQFRLPSELVGIESQIREHLRQLLERGHVSVQARWTEIPNGAGAVVVDVEKARQVVRAVKELKQKLRLKGEPDLAFVARHPDVLSLEGQPQRVVEWGEVQPILDGATREVLAMREREGSALATDLLARLDAIESLAQTVGHRAPLRLAAELERLKRNVAELAAGVQVDAQRLAVEIALLADRVDVSEELVRLRTHVAACRTALAAKEGSSIGKQLGFLAQEILREVNTVGSKANDAAITQAVIAMKGELERFREQLENLE
ncbi:MAG TPA: YicC/YloC family endoribonuclease [Gemmatimonadales bacterium]|nr:YicC/YloC family endoribonuclease [Gemmatimonadales bacterium]